MKNTEETIAKYAVDANLFRLRSTNPKKKYPAPGCFCPPRAIVLGGICPGLIYRELIVGELLYRGLIVGGLFAGGVLT